MSDSSNDDSKSDKNESKAVDAPPPGGKSGGTQPPSGQPTEAAPSEDVARRVANTLIRTGGGGGLPPDLPVVAAAVPFDPLDARLKGLNEAAASAGLYLGTLVTASVGIAAAALGVSDSAILLDVSDQLPVVSVRVSLSSAAFFAPLLFTVLYVAASAKLGTVCRRARNLVAAFNDLYRPRGTPSDQEREQFKHRQDELLDKSSALGLVQDATRQYLDRERRHIMMFVNLFILVVAPMAAVLAVLVSALRFRSEPITAANVVAFVILCGAIVHLHWRKSDPTMIGPHEPTELRSARHWDLWVAGLLIMLSVWIVARTIVPLTVHYAVVASVMAGIASWRTMRLPNGRARWLSSRVSRVLRLVAVLMIVPVLVWSALVLWPADDNSPWVDVRLRYEKTQGDGKEQLKNLPEEVFTNGWKSACLVYLVKGQYHDRGLCEDRLASYALLLLWRPVDGFACPVLGWGCRALDLREGSVVATSSDTRDNNPGVLAVVSNRLAQRDLRYARFEGAKIIGVDWSSSNLHGALFDRAKLTDVRFGEADLDGVSFVGAVFTKAEFRGTKMRGTILRRASMDGALLEDVDALRADFAGVTAAGMTVKGGVYVDSCWYKARLFELTVSLSDTDGSPAMVRPDKTSGAPVPEGCALPTLGARRVCGANDVVAKQPPSSPQGVAKLPIRRASFAGARMCNAELAGARLAKADFSRVAFDAAVLIGAIFTDVHVSDARFPSANLYLVRFDAVRGRTDKLDPPRASAGAVRSSGTELGAIHGANPIEGSTLDNDRCPDETGKVIREALLTICRSEPETKAVMRNLYPDSRYRAVDMPPLLPTITQCVETTMQKEPCKAIWEKMSKP